MSFLLLRNVSIGSGRNTSLAFLSRYKIFKCLLIKSCKDFKKGQYVTTKVIRLDLVFLVLLFSILILFRMGIFRGCSGMAGPPLPEICHTYPTTMKLGTVIPHLKKIQKIYEYRTSADISIFSREISKFLLHQEIEIEIDILYMISNSFSFSWVFKDFLIKPGYDFDDISQNGYLRSS